MVRVYGPMMSLDASGSLAQAIVFSKWKGRNYVRERVIPANPKSGGQRGMRAMLKFLAQNWTNVGDSPQASWEARADAASISPFNAFTSYNQKRWRNFTGPTDTYPEATTDVDTTLSTLALTLGERSITVTQAVTTAADGWGILIFRSPTGTFDTGWDNLIAALPIDSTNDIVYVDTPLTPGDYYYDVRPFTLDGQIGAEVGEETETVV